ncbi:hypothetical protein CS369_07025 [Candidatus Symbiopectobacterium sp. 'North America']|uniref:YagU family protein n=1 Tax=Candidatus Symbiopectobacterium sp. 'North America' TaxID=2794574 RepID=UPI0018CAB5FC|nr:DUF1440 domain-containing protein [Candidatus Symbiopectobacterium sp. 'North America']MBG6244589.1 hypothetical protein [Candidatus Symbiopectobacterium sp. 'North America']
MQLRTTRDKILVALLVGIIADVVCALAKFGWEIPFPPRTPLRDLTNPPQQLLQQMGMSFDMSHLSYLYNGNLRPIMSFIMYFGFSITFAVIYCVVAEVWPKIKLCQGALYGLVLHVVFHVFLLPLMGTVPAPWDQPFAEHFSEIFGHMFCFWLVEIVRRDLRNRITHAPDVDEVTR